jgi:hypothetical protein
LVQLYESRGTLDRLEGDTTTAASAWLVQARVELSGVDKLIENGSYRLDYNAAHDILRHAAEAVLEKAGARVTSAQGSHETLFTLANELVGDQAPEVFAGQRATPSRLKRHNLEYISDNPVSVDEADAREALQWANEAVAAAEPFVALSSAPRI